MEFYKLKMSDCIISFPETKICINPMVNVSVDEENRMFERFIDELDIRLNQNQDKRLYQINYHPHEYILANIYHLNTNDKIQILYKDIRYSTDYSRGSQFRDEFKYTIFDIDEIINYIFTNTTLELINDLNWNIELGWGSCLLKYHIGEINKILDEIVIIAKNINDETNKEFQKILSVLCDDEKILANRSDLDSESENKLNISEAIKLNDKAKNIKKYLQVIYQCHQN